MRSLPRVVVCCVAAVLAAPALAADGRREINQAAVLAAGGFPYVITAPGSYVLTSDLTPPASVIGIRIDTDDVNLDLNGFAIRGTLVCVPGSCTGTGPSAGIAASVAQPASGRRCTVRNGALKGISGNALELRDESIVDGLSVSNAFTNGIVLGPRSLVTRTRVTAVGRSGLVLGADSGYAENVIAGTGQFFTLGSVVGGKQVGRNACDDGRCPPRRRYYLTTPAVNQNRPTKDCEPGFHFAHAAEIADPTQLEYYRFPGAELSLDGSIGPSWGKAGWVRVGIYPADTTFGCANWSSIQGTDEGATLVWNPGFPVFIGERFGAGWLNDSVACSSTIGTWCVED